MPDDRAKGIEAAEALELIDDLAEYGAYLDAKYLGDDEGNENRGKAAAKDWLLSLEEVEDILPYMDAVNDGCEAEGYREAMGEDPPSSQAFLNGFTCEVMKSCAAILSRFSPSEYLNLN